MFPWTDGPRSDGLEYKPQNSFMAAKLRKWRDRQIALNTTEVSMTSSLLLNNLSVNQYSVLSPVLPLSSPIYIKQCLYNIIKRKHGKIQSSPQ